MKAYLFTTEEIAEDAVTYGLKLSHNAAGCVSVYGTEHPYMEAYLHPADYALTKRGTAVLKLQLEDNKAFVGEGMFTGERYLASLVPAKSYRLGTYRKPRCLIIASVFPEQIERYDAAMDEPLLYENSESLYRDCVLGPVQESDAFKELALRAYYEQEAQQGRVHRNEGDDYVVFTSLTEERILFGYSIL
ncbi:MAG: hypothetical protein IKU26_03880 [Clostridia bacterium]|nr:hypothetical protein [Clostridia bacterium]